MAKLKSIILSLHLQKAISNQSYQQLVSVLLPYECSVFRRIHAGEVEHGYVRLSVVVHGVVQRWQLVVGAEVSRLPGVGEQSLLIDVVTVQESFCLNVILIGEGGSQKRHNERDWLKDNTLNIFLFPMNYVKLCGQTIHQKGCGLELLFM